MLIPLIEDLIQLPTKDAGQDFKKSWHLVDLIVFIQNTNLDKLIQAAEMVIQRQLAQDFSGFPRTGIHLA